MIPSDSVLAKRVLLAVLAALPGPTCRKEPPSVRYDLARDAPLAEWVYREQVGIVASPIMEVHPGGRARREDGARPQLESRIFLRWREAAPRMAVLDLESAAGSDAVTVSLNEHEPQRLVLKPGRHRYKVVLPGQAQRAGDNQLRLVFAAAPAESASQWPPRFHGLLAGADADPALEALLERDAAPVAVERSGGRLRLVQAGPSALRFAVRLPAAAELRFRPERPEGAAGAVRFRVTVETEGGPERELASATLADASPAGEEVALRLPGRAGQVVRLALRIDGGSADGFAQGRWDAPRVMGRGPDPVPARSAGAPGRELQAALAGSNVLVVVFDAARAGHFGCYGYGRTTSPEIDRIAAEGVVFERAYTPAPYTVSAISSLWTSQYHDQHHHGVRHRGPLAKESVTLAELLSARGVLTAGFVSNPSAGAPFGLDRGFSEFQHLYRDGAGTFRGIPRAEQFRPALRSWLARARGRRFLAYVHYLEPHFPYDPLPPFDTVFGPDAPLPRAARRDDGWIREVNAGRRHLTEAERAHLFRLYDGNLAYVDREVGVLRAMLVEAGLWDRTVLILTADHGEELLEHGSIGHGASLYEESLRIPLVVRFPRGTGPAGARVRQPVDLLDVAPTIAELFGLGGEGESPATFEGRSLLGVAAEGRGKPALFARTMQERPSYSLNDGAFKLIHSLKRGRSELYDVERDPRERSDLSAQRPIHTEFYRQWLYRWLGDLKRARGTDREQSLARSEIEALKALGYVH